MKKSEITLGKAKMLLEEAAPKIKSYQAKRKEKREMGHDFNIFSIMGMERSEVKTHSAMIAELFNPRGSHGQGDIFLRTFLEVIKECKFLSNLDKKGENIGKWLAQNTMTFGTVVVMTEKSYPNVEGSEKDNRIDVVIEFENLVILIENKVDALDQPQQLKRYADVGKDSGKDCCLLYLTKKGHDASPKSLGGEDIVYDKISYKKHIKSWLNLCLREESVIQRTSLQKAILQYRDIVEKITGTNMSEVFNTKMIELLMENDNLECAEKISKFIPRVKGKMLDDFFEKVKVKLEGYGFLEADTKKTKDLLWHYGKGETWFYGDTNKQRSRNFGLFFKTSVDGILFYVMVASRALHYGFVGVNEDKEIRSLENWEDAPEGFEHRKWKSLTWYSQFYKEEKTFLDFLSKPKKFIDLEKSDDFFEELKETIGKLKNESPYGVDKKLP